MLVLFIIFGCGLVANAKLVPRIFNGNNAWIEEYPYQVSLESNGSHLCGGSIISKHYVLTAAHCANLAPGNSKLSIRAGTSFPSEGGSLHTVTEFIAHKEFDVETFGAPYNDIAIIKVKEPFHYDTTRQPIELFDDNEEVIPGTKSVVTGFGLVTESKMADQLQYVVLTIISKQDCKRLHKRLPEDQICAHGDNGKDSCTGDSGGPIAVDGRLAGIVSWGEKCGDSRFPSVYTEVSHYRDWIKKHVQFE